MTDDIFLDDEPGGLSEQARRICHQLICGRTELSDLPELASDPQLASEVQRRLDACGLEIRQARGWGRWVITGAGDLRDSTSGHGLNEPQLAALAFLFVQLDVAPAPSDQDTPRMPVSDFTASFGRPRGWKADYVRRAVLGPLEALEYIRVITPGGERRRAYVQAGPRMSLLDRGQMLRRLDRAMDSAETDDAKDAA